jgi:hypothetical protein
LSRKWSELASTSKARSATIVLLALQLGGCAFDLMTEQGSLGSLLCLTSPNRPLVEWAGLATWAALAFSWIPGLVSLSWPKLRPVYWALVAAILPACLGQAVLIGRHILFCDAP